MSGTKRRHCFLKVLATVLVIFCIRFAAGDCKSYKWTNKEPITLNEMSGLTSALNEKISGMTSALNEKMSTDEVVQWLAENGFSEEIQKSFDGKKIMIAI